MKTSYSRRQDKHGLIKRDKSELLSVFSSHPELQKVILFGSRAMETHRNGSDIDLAIISPSKKSVKRIHAELEEETNIPYFFDVIDLENISTESLKEHIKKYGVVLYEKK